MNYAKVALEVILAFNNLEIGHFFSAFVTNS